MDITHWLYLFLKVEELEKEILESRQKIEYFGAKMQELVSIQSSFVDFLFHRSIHTYVCVCCVRAREQLDLPMFEQAHITTFECHYVS